MLSLLPSQLLSRALLAPMFIGALATCGDGTGPDRRPTHPSGTDVDNVLLSADPYGLAISSRGDIYVARRALALVSRLDPRTGAVTASMEVENVPVAVSFDRSGSTAYVTNEGNESVSVIDVNADEVRGTIPVQHGSPKLAIPSPSGSKVYIADGGYTVLVASAATLEVLDGISVPLLVFGMAIGPGDTLLYTGSATGEVAEIDLRTDAVNRTMSTGGELRDVVVSADGGRLFAANLANRVDVLDLESGEVVDTIPLDSGAFGMALSPDGEQLYVTLPGEGAVVIVDAHTLEEIRTIPVGGRPRRVAFSARGDLALVTNDDGWVSFIR